MESIESIRAAHEQEFSELVAMIQAAGTDNLSHFKNGYLREGGDSLQQNPFELAALVLVIRDWIELRPHMPTECFPIHYLEIGTASGGVAELLAVRLAFDSVTMVDDGTHHRAPERPAHVRALRQISVRVQEYIGDSHAPAAKDFLERTRVELGAPWDVGFIDGDHTYQGVKQDLHLVTDGGFPFVRKGGLVIFHDIVACAGDVGRCWREACDDKRLRPIAELIGQEVPLGIAVGEVL